jgi:hypothetical protein
LVRATLFSALNQEDQARVLTEFMMHGTEWLKPIFEALGETIPYDELHVMRMVALCLEYTTSAARSRGQNDRAVV